jgi:hypothetical protein
VTWRGAATVFVGLTLAAAVAVASMRGGVAGIDGRVDARLGAVEQLLARDRNTGRQVQQGDGRAGRLQGAARSRVKRICDRVAGLSGHDSAPGTLKRPYRTVHRLLADLRPGGVGCLLSGTFVENVRFARGGARGRPITLRAAPGVRASILGYVWIKSSVNNVQLRNLHIDGSAGSTNWAILVQGDDITLYGLDIKNPKRSTSVNGICILAGSGFETTPANTAYRLTVDHVRSHNCGDDAHEHGIYLESTRNAVIRDSWFYDNPGMGIDFYPDAQGTVAEYNLIDGNSLACKENLGFSGEKPGGEYTQPHGSSNNIVRFSLITNAACRYNVDSYYPPGSLTPVGNVVEHSCIWNAPLGNFGRTPGYSEHDNIDEDPLYMDRDGKDFRLQSGSPCLGFGPKAIQPASSASRRPRGAMARPSRPHATRSWLNLSRWSCGFL